MFPDMTKLLAQESKIVTSSLEQLKAIHPLRIVNVNREGEQGWDSELTIKTTGETYRYLFEVKTHLRPQAIHHLLIRAHADRKRWRKATELLLLADYINPVLANQLKQAGVNFIDTAGNLFLKRSPGLYLYIEGKRPPLSPKDKPTRLFQPSGLTLLFGLLVEPESINRPYRDLAGENGVALGTVGWVKRDLLEQGYLEPTAKDRVRLIRRKELFDRWVQGYASRLRPKCFAGEYRDLRNDLPTVAKTFGHYAMQQALSWSLTGGFGADVIIHHYQGNSLTLFVESWQEKEALKNLKWLPVSGGPITILKSFSPRVIQKPESQHRIPAAHPILIYAELLHHGTDRDRETAQLMYKEFLEDSIAKD